MKNIGTQEEFDKILGKRLSNSFSLLDIFSDKEIYNNISILEFSDNFKFELFNFKEYTNIYKEQIVFELYEFAKSKYNIQFNQMDFLNKSIDIGYKLFFNELNEKFEFVKEQFKLNNQYLFDNDSVFVKDFYDLSNQICSKNIIYNVKNTAYLDIDNRDFAVVYCDGILVKDKTAHSIIFNKYFNEQKCKTYAFGHIVYGMILFDMFCGNIDFEYLSILCKKQLNIDKIFIIADTNMELITVQKWKKI